MSIRDSFISPPVPSNKEGDNAHLNGKHRAPSYQRRAAVSLPGNRLRNVEVFIASSGILTL